MPDPSDLPVPDYGHPAWAVTPDPGVPEDDDAEPEDLGVEHAASVEEVEEVLSGGDQ